MKFFYLGMQRCGTKSFGDFFRKNGFNVCSWNEIVRHRIGELYWSGQWLDILKCGIFEKYDVFEDGPFFHPQFARFLANYVPNSRFVYFHRPSDDWFKSMITHSNGLTLGQISRHAYLYDRLEEMEFLRDNFDEFDKISKLPMIGMKDHYTRLYRRHQLQVSALFKDFKQERFFSESLYDESKFEKMSRKFGLRLQDSSEQKSHQSNVSFSEVISNHKYLY